MQLASFFSGSVLCALLAWANPATGSAFFPDPVRDPEINGCSLEAIAGDSDSWRLVETSEGREGNRGGEFVFRLAPDAPVLRRINEVLAQPEGGEPIDFSVCGRLIPERKSRNRRLVSFTLQARLTGEAIPREEQFGLVDVKHSGAYLSGEAFELSGSFGRTRLRIRPSGGRYRVRGVELRISIRVDTGAQPERVTLEHPRLEEIGAPDAATVAGGGGGAKRGVVLCPLGFPPASMLQAWAEEGYMVRASAEAAPGERVAGYFVDGLEAVPKVLATTIADAVRSKSVFLCVGAGLAGLRADLPEALACVLPAHVWTLKEGLLRTGDCIVPTERSPLPISARLNARFDLHLPGSPIESPLAVYQPELYEPSLQDWKALTVLSKTAASGLPALIQGRFREASVLLFCGSFDDVARMAPSYAAAVARQASVRPENGNVDLRSLQVAPCWADLAPPLDRAAPASVVLRTADGAKARLPAYAIALEEDESDLAESLETRSPGPREGIDGITSMRYIHRPGVAPRLRVRLRNRFANIAPFAEAKDELRPDNPSAPGLNDCAQTDAHLRGTLPIHAIWTGYNGTDRQRVALVWKQPVRLSALRLTGNGPYRFRNRANPRHFRVLADGAEAATVRDAVYTETPSAPMRAFFEMPLACPEPLSVCTLEMTGLDPKADLEPRRDWRSNVSISEWEAYGWPADDPDASAAPAGVLTVTRIDLLGGRTQEVARVALPAVEPIGETTLSLRLAPLSGFGPAVYALAWKTTAGKTLAQTEYSVFFIPEGRDAIVRKVGADIREIGLLCTPGWRGADSFGLGMNAWTKGWGGPHDQTWALETDVYEIGVRNRDAPERMMTTAVRVSHYTNPWGRFPNGEQPFRWVMERLLERFGEGGDLKRQGCRGVYVVGSDRWNGVSIPASHNWNTWVDFDLWLRANGKPGLKGRTREALSAEISGQHGAEWQRFLLERYADLLLEIRRAFEARGLSFSWETHGSFPLCGGALGKKLAETHTGVGTDLFWELRKQDLWASLGSRIAIVASNPNLRSGAYDEWGWVNSDANCWWFANNGNRDVATRQWLATYFLGRIETDGVFRPYHEMGYGAQGNHGPRYTIADHAARCRVENLVTHLRPAAPAGMGLVVSWTGQERRMSGKTGRSGFGLYPADGETDVETLCEQIFTPLAKSGYPISYVTSTDSLRALAGRPASELAGMTLLLADAFNWTAEEQAAAEALRCQGVNLIAVGMPDARYAPASLPPDWARFTPRNGKCGAFVPVRVAPERLDENRAMAIRSKLSKAGLFPIAPPAGTTAVAFRTEEGLLAIALCNQTDEALDAPLVVQTPLQGDGRAVCVDVSAGIRIEPEGPANDRYTIHLPPSGAAFLLFAPESF